MIKHSIIVHEPPPPPPPPPAPSYSSFMPPRLAPVTPGWKFGQPRHELFKSDDDFEKYLLALSFKVGDFVTYSHVSSHFLQPSQISYIVAREWKREKLTYDNLGQPEVYALFNLPMMTSVSPWRRWDSPRSYRLITDAEKKTLIEPNNDLVQNRITEERARFFKSGGAEWKKSWTP